MLEELQNTLAACGTQGDLKTKVEALLQREFNCTRHRVFYLREFEANEQTLANPVTRAFFQNQMTLHEAQVVSPETWAALCPRADHCHVLVGPLVKDDALHGILAVTRTAEQGAFQETELAKMNLLSLHCSLRLSRLPGTPAHWDSLTDREQEVALLVGQGMTNQDVARQLHLSVYTVKDHLKCIFRKLNVTHRTQLASQLLEKMRRSG